VRIHEQICRKGFDSYLQSFVQYYGAEQIDANLLMLPLVGFLPASDSRIRHRRRHISNSANQTRANPHTANASVISP